MLGGKWVAYLLTSSSAIFSDAAESVVHLAATAIAAFGVWYSRRPADESHPYGHGKIAYFSAGFEGAFILFAAASIVTIAIRELIAGPELQRLGIGLLVTGALGAINLALGLYLVRTGRKHDSLALVANGHHVLTDMWTSLGVVVGVGVVLVTGILWLDPVIALIVGSHIAWTALRLLRTSFHGLMERVDSATSKQIIELLEEAVSRGTIDGFHQLRHRQVDDTLWIDVHLLLAGDLDVTEAHTRATEVEGAIKEGLPTSRVVVSSHVEPSDHAAAHPEGHSSEDPFQATAGS